MPTTPQARRSKGLRHDMVDAAVTASGASSFREAASLRTSFSNVRSDTALRNRPFFLEFLQAASPDRLQAAKLLAPAVIGDPRHTDRANRVPTDRPCNSKRSTRRSFATISSGLRSFYGARLFRDRPASWPDIFGPTAPTSPPPLSAARAITCSTKARKKANELRG